MNSHKNALSSHTLLLAIAFTFTGTLRLAAVDYTWTGAGGNNWATPTSWNPNGVPGAEDRAVINSGTPSIASAVELRQLDLNGGTLTVGGSLVVTGAMNWQVGTLQGTGNTTIAAPAMLTIFSGNNHVLSGHRLINEGTVDWQGGHVFLQSASVVTSAGLWLAQAPNGLNITRNDGGAGYFHNSGTFRKTVNGNTDVNNQPFYNPGLVEVLAGELRIVGGGSTDGTFSVAAAAFLRFFNSHSFADGGELLGPGLTVLHGGTYPMNGLITVENLGMGESGTVITGTNVLAGTVTWDAGTFQNGQTTIAAGSMLRVTTGSAHVLNAHLLVNEGTADWQGGHVYLNSASVVTNAGLWLAQAPNGLNITRNTGNPGYFHNSGTFRKTVNGNTDVNNQPFYNPGLVEVLAGELRIVGGGSTDGTFSVAAAAFLRFFNSHSFADGGELLGPGLTVLHGGTYPMNGLITVENLGMGESGTVITGTNVLAGTVTWDAGTFQNGQTTIAAGSMLRVTTGSAHVLNAHLLVNEGTADWQGGHVYLNSASVVTNAGLWLAQAPNGLNITRNTGNPGYFHNSGTFRKTSTGATSLNTQPLYNYGLMDITNGTLSVENFTYQQFAGELRLAGGNFFSPLANVQGGAITGFGTITGPVFCDGILSPGTSAGTLNITGNLTLGPNAQTVIELAGAATWDRLQVSGTATLAGSVTTTLIDDFYPAANATFTFLTGTRSGSFANLYYPSNDVGIELTYTANSASLHVINVRPVLPVVLDQTVNELELLSVVSTATDDDVPAQILTYALPNAPDGAGIDSNGIVSWTPTEAQGPMVTNITVSVTDNGTPNLTVTRTFQVAAQEINLPPSLVTPPQTVNELTTLSLELTTADPDIPTNTVTVELVSGPAGLTVAPDGVLNWTPTETQGPGEYQVLLRLTDDNPDAVNEKQLTVTNALQITVWEVNVPPVLPVQTNRAVLELTTLTVTNTATDSDLPANALTYTLLDAPVGAGIDANGVITWTPTEEQGPSTNIITTVVMDNNPDAVNQVSFSVTNTFTVIVEEVNVAPMLTLPPDTNINELVFFTANAAATDPDVPTNALTFVLVSGPDGLTVSPDGVINWTPTEAQGPSTNTVVVSVTDLNPQAINATSLSVTNSYTLIVREVNVPPVLPAPDDQFVIEETPLSVIASATDADLPANVLTYSLLAPPTGVSIHPASGEISWTPTEAQGSNVYHLTVVVTDENPQAVNEVSFSVTNSFVVIVLESNRPPMLTLPPDAEIDELAAYNANATATDPDLPANTLTYELVSGPAGLTVSPAGGISWTPTETQGPSTNTVTIRVADNNPDAVNATSLSVTNSYILIVREANVAPVVGALGNYTVNAGQTISFTATATDADLPANTLSFSLLSPPAGAGINPASGLFNWRPGAALADTTNHVQVVVTDNGIPGLSGTNSFQVIINPLAPVELTPLDYAGGHFSMLVTGSAGPDYILMASTNLTAWSDVLTNLSPNPPFQITDTNAGDFPSRTYQIRLSP